MGKKDDIHAYASQKEVSLYMEANKLSFECNKICKFTIKEVYCELDDTKKFRKDIAVGVIDENNFMHIDICEAWNANEAPISYQYDFQTFKFYPCIGLVITGKHPKLGNYKTTIYNN